MNIEDVKANNMNLTIKSIDDYSFVDYGTVITDIDCTPYLEYMDMAQIPSEGNVYEPTIEDMERLEVTNRISSSIYGEMPIQVGYCNGNNRHLNGFEYHKGSETIYAVTDLVLMLGKVKDIKNDMYDSSKVEIFFVPKGVTVELYQTTLHFSPCEVNSDGFKAVIILPKGTNLPLENEKYNDKESKTLFKKNKWLIVHESNERFIKLGVHVGITGENISIAAC